MNRIAIAGLAGALSIAATISRANEDAPRTYRLQRQTASGVEEKFVTEDEYNQFMQDAVERGRPSAGEKQQLEGMFERNWDEFRPATGLPDPIGASAQGQGVYPQPSRYQPLAVSVPAVVAPHPAPCQPGTFSVVSAGKRSILIDTTTGGAWLLVVGDQGSHWEAIKFPVPAAPIPETPARYLPGPSTLQASAVAPTPAKPRAAIVSQPTASTLSASDIRRLEEAYTTQVQTINSLQRQSESAKEVIRKVEFKAELQKRELMKRLSDREKEITELSAVIEQLKSEAKREASAQLQSDVAAPAEPAAEQPAED